MIVSWRGEKYYVCGLSCMDSYKTDMSYGLIYGPYKLDGRFVSGAVFSMAGTKSCVYCGQPEPARHDCCACTAEDCADRLKHAPNGCHYPPAEGSMTCEDCPTG